MRNGVVIGGSFAGLTAAFQLAPTGRDIAVVDPGAPRDRTSLSAYGVLGWDGAPQGEIRERIRADLARCATVVLVEGLDSHVPGAVEGFRVELLGSGCIEAPGVTFSPCVYDMPRDAPDTSKPWGRTLQHGPYCHGHEVQDRPLAALAVQPLAAHQATMLRAEQRDDITLLTGDGDDVAPPERVRSDQTPLEMSNGCICFTLHDSLLDEVRSPARDRHAIFANSNSLGKAHP